MATSRRIDKLSSDKEMQKSRNYQNNLVHYNQKLIKMFSSIRYFTNNKCYFQMIYCDYPLSNA